MIETLSLGSRQEWVDEAHAAIVSPVLQRLYDYWDDRRGAAPMPARTDIDPIEFRFALGHLLLIDILEAPRRFRVRVHGTVLSWHAGLDMTGRMLHEVPDDAFRTLADYGFLRAVEHGRPLHAERHSVRDDRLRCDEAIMLPLGADHHTPDMLLIGLICHDADRSWLRPQPAALAGMPQAASLAANSATRLPWA